MLGARAVAHQAVFPSEDRVSEKPMPAIFTEGKLLAVTFDPLGIFFGISNQRVYQWRAFLLALSCNFWFKLVLCAPARETTCLYLEM